MDPMTIIKEIMTEFAASTGLSDQEHPPRRYLWTDAFAVCNFLELFRRTGDNSWRQLALGLVNQVHHILGRHRDDDSRTGWISGLSEEEAERHPTIGGLRIGKQLNERRPEESFDERLEWERDGQYFHYLTRWMHALNRVSRLIKDPVYNSWAIELAKGAHAGFVDSSPSGSKRMYWKMSIDLSGPLVPSMGHHDPLDGLVTYHQLQTTASEFSGASVSDLSNEIKDMELLCEGKNWVTDDPLGLGGMLGDALKIAQLFVKDGFSDIQLLGTLLKSSLAGLRICMGHSFWKLPPESRLAFRELGLALGLHAVERTAMLIKKNKEQFGKDQPFENLIDRFRPYADLSQIIEEFWFDPVCQESRTWIEHLDINRVMLVASLVPDGYLEL